MLVIGSGGAGLQAALAAARGRRARAARDQARARLLEHRQGPGRHPGRARRGRRRPSGTPPTSCASSHETADPRLVEVLTRRGARGDRAARALRRRVHARRRRPLPARPLRRRDAQAAAAGRRPHGPRDRDRAARRGRGRARRVETLDHAPLRALEADAERLARDARAEGRRRRLQSRPAPSCSPPAGRCYAEAQAARDVLDERRRRHRRGHARSRSPRAASARDLDALQYHPNGGLWPVGDAGLLDPRDDARLRRAAR